MYRILFALIFGCFGFNSFGQAAKGKLLGTWADTTLEVSNVHKNAYNEVWGLEVNDHEFAVIGTTRGTHIIDVTDPTTPTELFYIKGGTSGPVVSHRDFHDYKGYLYATADQGISTTLQIIDISQLPDTIEMAYESPQYFNRSHNIFIDSSKAKLYSFMSNGLGLNYSPMRIFDISNPIDPIPIGKYDRFENTLISQVHDAFVRNDTAYLNLGPNGMAIVNFENVDTPDVISLLDVTEYPQSGYNHSGWITDNGYYYMADENFDSDIKVLDISSLPDVSVVNTFNAEATDMSMPHNQIVHGDKLYVSYYYDGLQVYDITDPENPQREMYYDTSTEVPVTGQYRGAWGVYPFLSSGNILVSDMQNGLFVIDSELPLNTEDPPIQNDLSIYPNPSNGIFHIDIPFSVNQSVQVDVFDSQGRLVKQKASSSQNLMIDLAAEVNGVYNVIVTSQNMTSTHKLILVKE